MRGIDISNWQAGLDVANLPTVEFVVAKATEGVGFVDQTCDNFIEQAKEALMFWGFYHFAGSESPEVEASFFVEHTWNYFGHGIPVLDWEGDQSVDWVNRFVRKVHEMTQVWPVIYGNPWRFQQGGVESNCGVWVASYPDWYRPDMDRELPNPPDAPGLVCMWQFASDGKVPGANGLELDVDVFYGDGDAWKAYAQGERGGASNPVESSKVSVLQNGEYRITVEKL